MGKADDIVKKDRLTTKTLTTDCEKQKKKNSQAKICNKQKHWNGFQ